MLAHSKISYVQASCYKFDAPPFIIPVCDKPNFPSAWGYRE